MLRRQYYIYPEIQKPMLNKIFILMTGTSFMQLLTFLICLYVMQGMETDYTSKFQQYTSIAPWKLALFVIILVPMFLNIAISCFVALYVSNRFAGPIYRIEKEVNEFMSGKKSPLKISLRKNDYLHDFAAIITKVGNFDPALSPPTPVPPPKGTPGTPGGVAEVASATSEAAKDGTFFTKPKI